MTKNNSYSSNLDSLVSLIRQDLRPLGYRKSKRLFNRLQPDGIIHVIDFQMGANWSSLWGKFTVEVGVFVPEAFSILYEKEPPKFVRSPICVERERIGTLGKSRKDTWWDLSGNLSIIEKEVSNLLTDSCENYLFQLNSREKLISIWENERTQRKLSQQHVLILAIIYSYLGKRDQANKLLASEFGNQYKTVFLEYARNVVAPLGLSFTWLEN
jgi:Domain of unknown function (DUF4304)